jgi:ATP-dependent helicase/nuclease subunit A
MPATPRARAIAAQRDAADPAVSAWVEASAGSGKTKLLTDRVLRLLLAGVTPGRILCLTFTKAAAAEMATRVNQALGAWAIAPDAELTAQLHALTGAPPAPATLLAARRLFPAVLEQPGGMRILTIHAFAQALLRAFPLEAGLPPTFTVLEDQDAAALLARQREAVLAGTPDADALGALARLVPATRFADLVGTLAGQGARLLPAVEGRQGLPGLRAALIRALGLPPGAPTEEALLHDAADLDTTPLLRAARLLGTSGNEKTDQRNAGAILAWLAEDVPARLVRWEDWRKIFLTDKGDPRAQKGLVTKDRRIAAHFDDILQTLQQEAARVAGVERQRAAARLLAATMALLAIGVPALRGYAAAKREAGLLDYDDLIGGARTLLEDPGSAWVLFKLDGGIDHVLLDEAQDSNPAQWGIVRSLTAEFFAGAGAERPHPPGAPPLPRSVFAVGDAKQSIYRFQGADAAGMARERGHYEAAVRAVGQEFRPRQLDVSFRSAPPVLALVDAVFAAGPARDGVVRAEETLRHLPDRAGAAGLVELWPLLGPEDAPAPPAWAPPAQPVTATGPAARLAAALAARIAAMIGNEPLPARGRPVRAGDILVLVRSRGRGGLQDALVRALKDRAVPVGGVDRMALVEQIAVQDCLALLDALLLPTDDLALAALLKSPLVGLDEDALFALAQGRAGPLGLALAAHRGQPTLLGRVADWLAAQQAGLDRATPHGLLAGLLGAPGPLDARPGRARLLARLGPEAADPLDELLNAALAHERRHPPSVQGFVHWLRQGGAEVKRQPDSVADMVRVMTVHGAKGLQAPIVILPDTVGDPPDGAGLRWLGEDADAIPVWAPRQEGFAAPALQDRRAADAGAERAESNRLLYVALTRAEDRLLVCGWHGPRAPAEGCWYRLLEAGFRRLPGVGSIAFDPAGFGAVAAGFAPGPLLRLAAPQTAPVRPDGAAGAAAPPAPLPGWASIPAPPEAAEDAIAPSSVPGEEETPAAAPQGATDPDGRRFRRGVLVHALLQHLPDLPAPMREAAGRRYLARRGHALGAAEQAAVLAEVLAVLAEPAIANAFGPGSLAEAPLAGHVGGVLVAGQVDRLLVGTARVLVLDYKTNRPPPAQPEAVAPPYLRQMAAYRAVLRQAFPGRAVDCALVWTYGARVMPLPAALLDRFEPGRPPA